MAQNFIFGEEGPLRFPKGNVRNQLVPMGNQIIETGGTGVNRTNQVATRGIWEKLVDALNNMQANSGKTTVNPRLTAQTTTKGTMAPKGGMATPATLAATLLTKPILQGANWLYNRDIERAGDEFTQAQSLESMLEAQRKMRGSANPAVRNLGKSALDPESVRRLLANKNTASPKNIPAGNGEALPPLPNVPSDLPIITPEIPQNVDVTGILNEAGVTPTGQNQQGRSVEDLIEQARALHEQKQNLLNPDTEALRGLIEGYSKNRGSDFYRDLGLAGLAGLTNNQAYAQMIGKYGTTEDELKKYQLRNQLTKQELGQVFDPMEIMANAALMERLGLPTEAALANKDVLGNYAKLIGYDVNKDIAERKLAESIRQHDEKMAQRRYEFENPNYNLKSSQMQAIGSLLNAATLDPAIRNMVRSPEFLDYVQKTIGFNPMQTPNLPPMSELDAAAQSVKTRGTFGGN